MIQKSLKNDSIRTSILFQRREFLHLYLDDQKAVDDTAVFNMLLEKLEETVKKNHGYFSLVSNDIKDTLEALLIYQLKDPAEKAFHYLKERLPMWHTSVPSKQNLEGKLLIQFLALIYFSYISKAMSDEKLYKIITMHELLDELDIIECFGHPGHRVQSGEITNAE